MLKALGTMRVSGDSDGSAGRVRGHCREVPFLERPTRMPSWKRRVFDPPFRYPRAAGDCARPVPLSIPAQLQRGDPRALPGGPAAAFGVRTRHCAAPSTSSRRALPSAGCASRLPALCGPTFPRPAYVDVPTASPLLASIPACLRPAASFANTRSMPRGGPAGLVTVPPSWVRRVASGKSTASESRSTTESGRIEGLYKAPPVSHERCGGCFHPPCTGTFGCGGPDRLPFHALDRRPQMDERPPRRDVGAGRPLWHIAGGGRGNRRINTAAPKAFGQPQQP